MTPQRLRVHDLVRCDADGVRGEVPGWVARDGRSVWAVVRRQPASRDGEVAAGVRGRARAERQAVEVDRRAVLAVVTPESLTRASAEGVANPGVRAALAAITTMRVFGEREWGPTGSTGFELATGLEAVHADSDLDVLVRADRRVPREEGRAVLRVLAQLPCRVDCLLEAPAGGLSLQEWAGTEEGPVLLRTSAGPLLVDDPWSIPVGAGP